MKGERLAMEREGLPVLKCFSGLVEAREVFSAAALWSSANAAEYLTYTFPASDGSNITHCQNQNA